MPSSAHLQSPHIIPMPTAKPRSGFRTFAFYHLPAILYAALIFAVSSIPQLRVPSFKLENIDKLIHFVEYSIFAYLIFRSFSKIQLLTRGHLAPLIAILFVSLYAASDEYHQRFVAGRDSSVSDLAADVLGAVLVILYVHLRTRRLARSQSHPT